MVLSLGSSTPLNPFLQSERATEQYLQLFSIDPKHPMAYPGQNTCQREVTFAVLRAEPSVSWPAGDWRKATTPTSVWNDPEWVYDLCVARTRAKCYHADDINAARVVTQLRVHSQQQQHAVSVFLTQYILMKGRHLRYQPHATVSNPLPVSSSLCIAIGLAFTICTIWLTYACTHVRF